MKAAVLSGPARLTSTPQTPTTTARITRPGKSMTVAFCYGTDTLQTLLTKAGVVLKTGEAVRVDGNDITDANRMIEPAGIGTQVQVQVFEQTSAG